MAATEQAQTIDGRRTVWKSGWKGLKMTKDEFRIIVETYGRAQRRALFTGSSMQTVPQPSAQQDTISAEKAHENMRTAFHEMTGMTLDEFQDAMRGMRVRPVRASLQAAVDEAGKR